MSCILNVIGTDLNIDEFLQISGLQADDKTYKGQPRFKTKPDSEKILYSAFSIVVSNAEFGNFKQQLDDVIHFLLKEQDKLKYILATKEIEYAVLDFGVDNNANKFSQSFYFPNDLVVLAAKVGLAIELSIYQSNELK